MNARQQRANDLIAKAEQHKQAGEHDEAIRLYREVIDLMADVPPYVSYNLVLGDLLFDLQRYQEAADCYRQLVVAFPEHDQGWNSLGLSLVQLGRHAEALRAFEQCVELAPQDATAWYYGAMLHARTGNGEAATAWLRRALKLQPQWRKQENIDPVLVDYFAEANKKWWQLWK